jgi:hypothetical protein
MFELAEAGRFDLAPIGWETADHLIVRLVSYEPYDGTAGQSSTVPPRYVAVRCAVETGECERLPHAVEVISNNVGSVLPPS